MSWIANWGSANDYMTIIHFSARIKFYCYNGLKSSYGTAYGRRHFFSVLVSIFAFHVFQIKFIFCGAITVKTFKKIIMKNFHIYLCKLIGFSRITKPFTKATNCSSLIANLIIVYGIFRCNYRAMSELSF